MNMKNLLWFSFILLAISIHAQKRNSVPKVPGYGGSSQEYANMPDLVVARVWFSGGAMEHSDGSLSLKIGVGITNRGVTKAGRFKTSVAIVKNDGNTEVVPFTVAGQSNTRFPMTSGFLPPGEQILLEGEIKISREQRRFIQPRTVTIITTADSTVEESLPATGRVNERSESNNTLQSDLNITLISREGP